MTEAGYSVEVAEGYDEAVKRTRLALRAEGFSVLTEMHVGGLLGPAAGHERQYLIMAVWDSAVSQRDIGLDLRVAVHMPCNVVVQEQGTSAMVAVLDPADAVEDQGSVPQATTAAATEALHRMLAKVASPA